MFNWIIQSNVTGESLIEIRVDDNETNGVSRLFLNVCTTKEYTGKVIAEVLSPIVDNIYVIADREDYVNYFDGNTNFPDGYVSLIIRYDFSSGDNIDRRAEFKQEVFRLQTLLSRLATKFACQIDLALANEEIEDLMR